MKDNKVNVDGLVSLVTMAYDGDAAKIQTAKDLANDCMGATDGDRCEAATKIIHCGHESAKTHGFSFETME